MDTLHPGFYRAGDLANLFALAERELGAFMTAVSHLFGPREGRFAGEEWLRELESSDVLPESNPAAWRCITMAAAARIAARVGAHLSDTKVLPIPSSNCSPS